MKRATKPILYAVFVMMAIAFGILAIRQIETVFGEAEHRLDAQTGDATQEAPTNAATRVSPGFAGAVIYLVGFVGGLVGLGILMGKDASKVLGSRFFKGMAGDERVTQSDPDYDAAEQLWADGHYLEAIKLMREYHQRNPNELHACIRIAEIYEKDLKNVLAAALEYEEILKAKISPERWGWSAIHLCNLYFKLNKQDKAVALLRQIDAEYGETPAADKARKRLALIESGGVETSPAQTAGIEEGEPPPETEAKITLRKPSE